MANLNHEFWCAPRGFRLRPIGLRRINFSSLVCHLCLPRGGDFHGLPRGRALNQRALPRKGADAPTWHSKSLTSSRLFVVRAEGISLTRKLALSGTFGFPNSPPPQVKTTVFTLSQFSSLVLHSKIPLSRYFSVRAEGFEPPTLSV